MENSISFIIEKPIGVISANQKSGWKKEVNLISWMGNPAKIDIRDWSPDHSKMGKGITLTAEEAKMLQSILSHFLSE